MSYHNYNHGWIFIWGKWKMVVKWDTVQKKCENLNLWLKMFLQTFARKKLPIKENLLFFETQISFFKCFFFILKSLQIYYFPSYPPIQLKKDTYVFALWNQAKTIMYFLHFLSNNLFSFTYSNFHIFFRNQCLSGTF